MKRLYSVLVFALITPLARAQSVALESLPLDRGTRAARAAEVRHFLGSRFKGRDVRKAIDRVVRKLHWHTKLSRAVRAAQAARKPIVWIQALGDLRGYT